MGTSANGGSVAINRMLRRFGLRGRGRTVKGTILAPEHLVVSPLVFYTRDPTGDPTAVAWVSENLSGLLGYAPREALDAGWWCRHLHPEDQADAVAALSLLESQERLAHEYRLRHRDGSYRWLRDEARLVRDQAGTPRVAGCWLDVTRRREVEEELDASRTRLQLLHEVATGLTSSMSVEQVIRRAVERIWEQFRTLRVTYATISPQGELTVLHSVEPPGMVPITGMVADLTTAPEYLELLKHRSPVAVVDVARDARTAPLADCIEGIGSRAVLDVPLHHSDQLVGLLCFDSPVPRTWSSSELATLQEIAEYLEVAIRDSHAQAEYRQVVEALRESQDRYGRILDTTNEGIWTVDGELCITYVNAQMCELLGYAAEELIGRVVYDMVPEPDRSELERRIERRKRGIREQFDLRLRRKDGADIWLLCCATPLLGEGSEFVGSLGMFTDITERRHAQEAIERQNRELAALHAITAAVSSSLELSEVLVTFRTLVSEELNVPGGVLYLRDPARDQFVFHDSWGLPAGILGQLRVFPLSERGCEDRLRGGDILLVDDFQAIPPLAGLGLDRLRSDWQGFVAVPLLAKGEIQGVVGLFGRTSDPFREDQRLFFKALGQEVGVAVQNARLFSEVRSWQERWHALSCKLVEMQENERRRLGRELHDEVGQLLTGLKLTLETGGRGQDAAGTGKWVEALSLAGEVIQRVRHLSQDLRPSALDDLGLLPALLGHFERYTAMTRVRVAFEHSGLARRFAPAVESAAYRIVQEALTNVARHADVDEVMVRLWVQSGRLGIQIRDRGVGFDPQAQTLFGNSSGLSGMRERALLLGGQLLIESIPREGTCVRAELPLGEGPGEESDAADDDRPGG